MNMNDLINQSRAKLDAPSEFLEAALADQAGRRHESGQMVTDESADPGATVTPSDRHGHTRQLDTDTRRVWIVGLIAVGVIAAAIIWLGIRQLARSHVAGPAKISTLGIDAKPGFTYLVPADGSDLHLTNSPRSYDENIRVLSYTMADKAGRTFVVSQHTQPDNFAKDPDNFYATMSKVGPTKTIELAGGRMAVMLASSGATVGPTAAINMSSTLVFLRASTSLSVAEWQALAAQLKQINP